MTRVHYRTHGRGCQIIANGDAMTGEHETPRDAVERSIGRQAFALGYGLQAFAPDGTLTESGTVAHCYRSALLNRYNEPTDLQITIEMGQV